MDQRVKLATVGIRERYKLFTIPSPTEELLKDPIVGVELIEDSVIKIHPIDILDIKGVLVQELIGDIPPGNEARR